MMRFTRRRTRPPYGVPSAPPSVHTTLHEWQHAVDADRSARGSPTSCTVLHERVPAHPEPVNVRQNATQLLVDHHDFIERRIGLPEELPRTQNRSLGFETAPFGRQVEGLAREPGTRGSLAACMDAVVDGPAAGRRRDRDPARRLVSDRTRVRRRRAPGAHAWMR